MPPTLPALPLADPANALTLLGEPLYQQLADVPPEATWFANIANAQTRRAYASDLRQFMDFIGIAAPGDFRRVTRAHVLAWRGVLERQALAPATIRRKLAALASLFEYLCNANAVAMNPLRGVRRPPPETREGKTPALSNAQARALLEAPSAQTMQGQRDRAILSVLLFHGLRREELTRLLVKDFGCERRGVPHLLVRGKGGKLRFLPLHPHSQSLVQAYLAAAGHASDREGALFRPLSHHARAQPGRALTPGAVYAQVVKKYLGAISVQGENWGAHALRATAATCALENGGDIAKVQEWLGHSNIATTRVYDRRETRPSQSPTFCIQY